MNESETIRIAKNNKGQLSRDGKSVEVDLTADARFGLEITVVENYNGPIEVKLTPGALRSCRMKLLETTLYPHPILNEEVDDFLTGIFRVTEDITVENIPAGTVEVAIAIELKQPEIEKLIEEGIIALDVLVTCDDTFYSKLHPLEIGESVTRFSNGELNGLVKLQPIIHAKKRILKYKSTDFNEEYGDSEFLIELGDPLGWTVPTYISVGQQKLKPLNTIFDIAIDSDLEDGEIQVDLAMPNITLRVNKEMAEHAKPSGKLIAVVPSS